MVTTRLFLSNRTQAVRLPKPVAFPPGVEEVEILVYGDSRVIVPKGRGWDWFFEHGPTLPDFPYAERDRAAPAEPTWWWER